MGNDLAELAFAVALAEERELGVRVGAGVIIERALQAYLDAHFTPEQLAELRAASTS
jgi:hypothetical protein